MPETPIFFERGAIRLFGVLHEPDAPNPGAVPFVFCHPLAEEKLWAHRVFVSFARELAQRGHSVLRFDCAGNGDSDLAFAASSVTSGVDDTMAAIDFLRNRTAAPRVALLGLRLGASLAYRAAANRDDVDTLVLWAPILEGGRYLQELLRTHLTTQIAAYGEVREDRAALTASLRAGGTVNVDGYEISKNMANELDTLSLLTEPAASATRALIVQIERAEQPSASREMQELHARLPQAALEVVREEPFWKEIARFYDSAPNLFTRTLRWLDQR
jgi:exosortase A-associated hydrolase 2